MVSISTLRSYLGLPPDAPDEIAALCLDAAKSKARAAGIPDYRQNRQYDLLLYALASLYYDNRSLSFTGTYQATAEETARKLINSFVLELRYAGEDADSEGGGEDGEIGEPGGDADSGHL